MKQLTCEMCGSTDLIKQDGVFVCQSCGCKYSVEEAKKMMIEGTVDVTGSVKIDYSSQIDTYLTLAENSLSSSNVKEAEVYSNKVLEIDSCNSRAWFIKGCASGWQSSLANLRISDSYNCFDMALKYCPSQDKIKLQEDISESILELSNAILQQAYDNFSIIPNIENEMIFKDTYSMLHDGVMNYCPDRIDDLSNKAGRIICYSVSPTSRSIYPTLTYPSSDAYFDYLLIVMYEINMLLYVIEICSDKMLKIFACKMVCSNFKIAINSPFYIVNGYGSYSERFLDKGSDAYSAMNELRMKAIEALKDLDPCQAEQELKEIDNNNKTIKKTDEISSSSSNSSSSGCYIATCVYGSYDCPQVWTLRRYRDDTLASTWYGRAFIRTYYAISPTIVKWFGNTQWFKKIWKNKLDKMVSNLRSNGVEDTPYQDKDWR